MNRLKSKLVTINQNDVKVDLNLANTYVYLNLITTELPKINWKTFLDIWKSIYLLLRHDNVEKCLYRPNPCIEWEH